MIIWLAGLQSIPQQLYEAASIDGANAWQRFKHVTIPMLSPYILFNFIIGLIGTMQIFGEAFIMTEGGPSNSTLFYAYHLFKQAFQFFRMGYASALAWILFVVVLVLTVLQLWASRKWVHYEQA
jgi:multiple sugar transport system permease protein